jgi:ADP-ribose pyrophosphatase
VSLRVDTIAPGQGEALTREVVEHPGAVAIVAVSDDGDLVLVEQWRHPVAEVLLEVPAGTLGPAEEPLSCAHRELAEETGYTAGRMEPLAVFYSAPGFCTERLHTYLATGLLPGAQALDEDEAIRVRPVPRAEAVSMCLDGRIRDAKSIAAILCAERALDRI